MYKCLILHDYIDVEKVKACAFTAKACILFKKRRKGILISIWFFRAVQGGIMLDVGLSSMGASLRLGKTGFCLWQKGLDFNRHLYLHDY